MLLGIYQELVWGSHPDVQWAHLGTPKQQAAFDGRILGTAGK